MPKGYRRTEEEMAAVVSKYETIGELREKDNSTYQLIQRHGLMDKLCGHLKRKERKDLSEEDLAEIVSHYDTLRELREEDPSAYSIIHGRGLFNKLCGHMKREVAKSKSDEELAEIALRYDIAKEFRDKEPAAYKAVQERGLIDKLCGHMKYEVPPSISDDELAETASHYSVLKDFRKKENSAYAIICKRGLFDKLCGHMERAIRVLPDDVIADIAQLYHSRLEFCREDSSAYSTACKRGIIDKICAHMKPIGNWAKRKLYVFTFSDGYAYVGLSQNPKRRYNQHIREDSKSPVRKHINETCATYEFKILTDWIDMDIVGLMEDDLIKQYADDGWKMLNKMKGGSLGYPRKGLYSRKRLRREADKYDYIEDFKKGSRLEYNYIIRHHLLDEYCSHMKSRNEKKCGTP